MVRTVAEFMAQEGDDAPKTAERQLVEAVRAGEACVLGKAVPGEATDSCRVRAALLRLLISDATPDSGKTEGGVLLIGGWVEGVLDLSFVRARGRVVLNFCRFEVKPSFAQAEFGALSLEDSHLPGLFAQGMRVLGSVWLLRARFTGTTVLTGAKIGGGVYFEGAALDGKGEMALNAQGVETGQDLFLDGVTATGTVSVAGAKIGGQLACDRARLDGAGGEALNAQGVETGASLFLSNVTATGAVAVNGAKIGDQLSCIGAMFDGQGGVALNAQGVVTGDSLFLRGVMATGTVDVNGARIGGQLSCTGATLDGQGAMALNAQAMRADALYWRRVTVKGGAVALPAARVGDLVDDGHWPTGADVLDLDGFVYDRISVDEAPDSAEGRRSWLEAGSVWKGKFRPQPYTQLARVLREMGHAGEARTVACWRDRKIWDQRRGDIRRAPMGETDVAYGGIWRGLWARLIGLWSFVLRIVAGYGFKPWRAVGCLLVLWAIAAGLAGLAWREGSFAPNSDVILTSDGWQAALAADCFPPGDAAPGCTRNPARVWSNDPGQGMDWDSFSALGYGIDLVVPVLDLGQTAAWAPSKDRGPAGKTLWWGRWVLQGAGWFVLLIFAAAVTGIMQRERE